MDSIVLRKKSADPGFLRSIFIHLAGGAPRIFRYLDATEASDFTKMGVSVLVPAMTALIAGSCTLYRLQEDRSITIAVAGGLLWALVILVIDMTVMSQLVKSCAPMKATAAPAPGRRRARVDDSPPPNEAKTSRKSTGRNFLIAGVRCAIAVVLGLFMSHTLVLTVFRNQVARELQGLREKEVTSLDGIRKEINEKQSKLDAAQEAAVTQSPKHFLEAYRRYVGGGATAPSPSDADAGEKAATSPSGAGSELESQRQETQVNYERRIGPLRAERQLNYDESNSLESDIRMGETMYRAEVTGARVDGYHFQTPSFENALGGSTSGVPGRNQRANKIEQFLNDRKADLKKSREKVAALDQEIKALTDAHKTKVAQLDKMIEEQAKRKLDALVAAQVETEQRFAVQVNAARTDLQTRIQTLSDTLTRLRQEESNADLLKNTRSHDPLEETQALINFIGREDKVVAMWLKLALVCLVFLSLLLIDLLPLTLKLLRPASAYDSYLALVREYGGVVVEEEGDSRKSERPRAAPTFAQDAGAIPPGTDEEFPDQELPNLDRYKHS